MLRLSQHFRAAASAAGSRRCLYQVLGVMPNSTSDEIKGAFRNRAKEMHPDTASGREAAFGEMVDAYRVLRDPRRRTEYDRDRSQQQQRETQYGPSSGYSGRSASSGAPAADAQFNPAGLKAESAAVGVLFCSGALFLFLRKSDAGHDAHDPYPSRRPASRSTASGLQSNNPMSTVGQVPVPNSSEMEGFAKSAAQAAAEAQQELVRAYWNPFAGVWHRIPEGYEAPASMDLTAWHKKRSDPAEWSRLFAEGKLSEIIPRGGLRERYRPAWDTHEPILVQDPYTRKTIQVTTQLPARNTKTTCDVQF